MDNSYDKRYDFNSRDIYDNIYDENDYESVLVYRNEMLAKDEINKKNKEILEDYKN